MPFPSSTFAEQIRSAYHWVHDELQHLYAQLEGWMRVEHKADGSHGAITGDSLDVTGEVDSQYVRLGLVDMPTGYGGVDRVGLDITPPNAGATGEPLRWGVVSHDTSLGEMLAFVDQSNGHVPMGLARVSGADDYALVPLSVFKSGGGTLDLGQTGTNRLNDIFTTNIGVSVEASATTFKFLTAEETSGTGTAADLTTMNFPGSTAEVHGWVAVTLSDGSTGYLAVWK